jgi:N-acetylglucosaminyl-diphospho-decaprenol L-rhamnosyltransferase
MNDVRCSIIIVTFNSAHVIGDCLNSIDDLPENFEIIVADNASGDSTLAVVEQLCPRARVIRTGGNLGFAKAVNIAALRATGSNILLLNPDATIATADVIALIDELDADPTIGVLAPAIHHPAGRLRTMSAGRMPTVWRMFCHFFGISRVVRERGAFEGHYLLADDRPVRRNVDWVTGACFAVPRALWLDLGGLTERWFMYAEDIEFCYRVTQKGKSVVLDTNLSATHLVGASAEGHETSSNPAWVINLFDFYSRDLSKHAASRAAWRAVVGAGLASRGVVFYLLSRRSSEPAQKAMWRMESRRFFSYALAVARAQPTP